MKTTFITIVLYFFTLLSFSQTKILSWNLENFGKSKTDSEINFIAATVVDYDIVAIQEVVAGYGGAQAIAKLAAILNEKGTKWDYTISEPTSSSSYKAERYAFIWKTSKAKLKGKPSLEQKFSQEIDREPYYATFEIGKKTITLSNFHAITKNKNPETEIKYFKFLPALYPESNLIFLGDFNCPQSHTVFFPLKKMGYTSILQNQKTTLKKECRNNVCLASEFDNIFYKSNTLNYKKSGVIHFYAKFNSLSEARKISDHLPIWVEFSLN